MSNNFENPNRTNSEQASMPYSPDEGDRVLTKIERVVQKHEQKLISIDGVIGIGIQNDPIGNAIIVIYVRDAGVSKQLPTQIEGWPVKIEVSGEIDALNQP